MKPWREIVDRKKATYEHVSTRGRNFTWWVSFQTTLTLSCGHKRVVRGSFGVPTQKNRCKECPDVGVERG